MPMNPEIKQKWIVALRSGEYNQGKGYLCINNKYCCLGVLSEIAGIPKEREASNGAMLFRFNGSTISGTFVYGLIASEIEGHEDKLIDMNDCKNASFDEIATYIEENL